MLPLLPLLLLCASLHLAAAQQCYSVTTFVGWGNSAPLVNGVGTLARIYSPYDMEPTPNATGYYVAEQNGHRVRFINMSTREVTCIAGSPNGTSGQVDGVGTNALLNSPEGLALDPIRNVLYVTSFTGTTLRRIDLRTRVVTTVAGNGVAASRDGLGTAASLQSLRGAAMDAANNLVYLGAWANCSIRLYNATSRYLSTLTGAAGCGATDAPLASAVRLYNPSVIRLINGSLWVADTSSGNFRILSILRPGVLGGSTSLMPAGQTFSSGMVRGFDVDLASGALYLSAYQSAGMVYRVELAAPTNSNAIAGNSSAAAGSVDGVGAAARFTQMLSCRYHAPTRTLLVLDFSASRMRAISLANCSPTASPSTSRSASATSSRSAAASATHSPGASAAVTPSVTASATATPSGTPPPSLTAQPSTSSSASDSPSPPPGAASSSALATATATAAGGGGGGGSASASTGATASSSASLAAAAESTLATASLSTGASASATATASGSASATTASGTPALTPSGSAAATASASASLSAGAPPSVSATASGSPPPPPSDSGTPTATLSVGAPASASATQSGSASAAASASLAGAPPSTTATASLSTGAPPSTTATASLSIGAPPSTTATASLSTGASPSTTTSGGSSAPKASSLLSLSDAAEVSNGGGGILPIAAGAAGGALVLAAIAALVVLSRRRRLPLAESPRRAPAAPAAAAAAAAAASNVSTNPLIAAAAGAGGGAGGSSSSGSFRTAVRPMPARSSSVRSTGGGGRGSSSDGVLQLQPQQQPRAVSTSDLPAGWTERMSSSRNRLYWVNEGTGRSTWERPTTE